MEENSEIKVSNDEIGKVALPFNKNQFADFIASLLGKPQTISKRLEGSFNIDLETIKKLHEIINQRIYQQNDGKLIQLRATIYYSDNSSITLDGYEHLVHYNESLPLVSGYFGLTVPGISVKMCQSERWCNSTKKMLFCFQNISS